MPKIIGQAEQQRAMKGIRSGLKALASINQFLNTSSKDNKYLISLVSPEGSRISALAFTENKDEIDLLVLNQRSRIVAEITTLAQQNRIEFDETDYMILENEVAATDDTPDLDFPASFEMEDREEEAGSNEPC